jgi:hypothetical protein
MKKIYFLLLLIIYGNTFAQVSGVGIGTSNPQQALHLAGATGTVRVDGLSSTNNAFNGGAGKTYPLYVNSSGDMSLQLATFQNSDGTDALTSSTPLITTDLTMTAGVGSSTQNIVILPYTITVNRAAVLEIKYNISFNVYSNAALVKIKDIYARRISTFYTVDGALRRYGQASKCYYNRNLDMAGPNAAIGTMYNSSTTYIPLTAGTHTIRFYGELNSGDVKKATHIVFAPDNDAVFMRLY